MAVSVFISLTVLLLLLSLFPLECWFGIASVFVGVNFRIPNRLHQPTEITKFNSKSKVHIFRLIHTRCPSSHYYLPKCVGGLCFFPVDVERSMLLKLEQCDKKPDHHYQYHCFERDPLYPQENYFRIVLRTKFSFVAFFFCTFTYFIFETYLWNVFSLHFTKIDLSYGNAEITCTRIARRAQYRHLIMYLSFQVCLHSNETS